MPELPEVETIVRKLQQVLPGTKISKLETLHPKTFSGSLQDVNEVRILTISRKAKVIRIHLENRKSLLIHF